MNFGPQHPAAHGVLRLVLYLDGEIRLPTEEEFEDYAWVKREELKNYIELTLNDKQIIVV